MFIRQNAKCAFVIRGGFARQSSKRFGARWRAGALIGSENSARPHLEGRPLCCPKFLHPFSHQPRARLKEWDGTAPVPPHRYHPISPLCRGRQWRVGAIHRIAGGRLGSITPTSRLSREVHRKTISNFKSSVYSTGFTF